MWSLSRTLASYLEVMSINSSKTQTSFITCSCTAQMCEMVLVWFLDHMRSSCKTPPVRTSLQLKEWSRLLWIKVCGFQVFMKLSDSSTLASVSCGGCLVKTQVLLIVKDKCSLFRSHHQSVISFPLTLDVSSEFAHSSDKNQSWTWVGNILKYCLSWLRTDTPLSPSFKGLLPLCPPPSFTQTVNSNYRLWSSENHTLSDYEQSAVWWRHDLDSCKVPVKCLFYRCMNLAELVSN